MKARIKRIICADIENLDSWRPADPDDVAIPIEMEIGPDDDDGADLFQALVANKTGFRRYRQAVPGPVACPRLFVLRFDWPAVKQRIESIVEECSGPDWPSIVRQWRTYFLWEYDGVGLLICG